MWGEGGEGSSDKCAVRSTLPGGNLCVHLSFIEVLFRCHKDGDGNPPGRPWYRVINI